MTSPKNILDCKLIAPTFFATIFASIPSAFAAEGSSALTKALEGISNFINIGVSDLTHCAVYNFIFPFIYGWMNRDYYTKNGKFEYGTMMHDLIFKIVPVGWVVSVLMFHVPRNVMMYFLIDNNTSIWASSIISDIIVTAFYIPFRFYALKYYLAGINYVKNKWSEIYH